MSFFDDIKAAFLGPSAYNGEPTTSPEKAEYISPSGGRFKFDFEDVTSSIESKAATFEISSGNGSYIQNNGHTSRRLPMDCFFYGKSYEKTADLFMSSLIESGEGTLYHPQYPNPIKVVPVGEISKVNNYVSGHGVTTVSVSFFETTGLQIGSSEGIDSILEDLKQSNADDFEASVNLDNLQDREDFKKRVEFAAKSAKSFMRSTQRAGDVISGRVEDISDSVIRGIDFLVGEPLTLAFQMQQLIGEPARTLSLDREKLEAYGNYAASLFSKNSPFLRGYARDSVNEFHLDRLMAKSAVANHALVSSRSTDEYQTRSELIMAADELGELLDDLQEWSDSGFEAIEQSNTDPNTIDQGGGVSELRDIVYMAMSALISKSFGAKTQVTFELDGERTPIDLCYELYGTTEWETLDRFYSSNDLSGDEYFLIPKGREIVYYV